MFPSRLTSLRLALLCAVLPVGLSVTNAHAEHADRDKPVSIESDRVTVDDQNKVNIFEGKVVLSQGTLMLRCHKLVVTQDAAGHYRGIASGSTGELARFRQKRDGVEEYTEGEGERIEHDSKLDQTELFNRAWIRSGKDEIRGEYIRVDGKTNNYSATSGPNGTTQTGRRVRAVIQPKKGDNADTSQPNLPLKAATELKTK